MKKISICLAMLFMSALGLFAQNSLTVEAPRVVTTDETFRVVFTADGRMSDFNWPGSPDFSIVWGPQSGSMSSTSIVNGKRTSSHQETYTYVLQAREAGKFTIPAATATIEHKEYSSNPFTIEVVAGETNNSQPSSSQTQQSSAAQQQDSYPSDPAVTGSVSDKDMFLRLSLGKTNLVKGEPVTATLKLYTRADITGFEDVHFPTFDGFWSKEIEVPQNIEFTRENVNGTIYHSALLRRYMLIPQQVGTLTIDPAEMVCQVRIISNAAPRSIFDSFFDSYQTIRKRLTTPAVRVNVKGLPAGAPSSFGGGVGDFKMDVSLNPAQLKTHEAASLTVTITGKGNISMLEAPKVNFPPDFEAYDMKSSDKSSYDGTSGTRTFEFPFIPRSHGDFTIEPVEYSYYDISKGKYVTLTSQPVQISVEKGEETDGVGIVMPGVARQGVKNIAEDIRFIRTGAPSLRRENVFFAASPLFWILLAIVAALYFIAAAVLRTVAARRRDVAGSKNRRANKMARARLKVAGDYLEKNLPTAYYEEVHKAVLGYVSDKLAIPSADLSKDRISEVLGERGVEAGLVGRLTSILDACEFARYAPEQAHTEMQKLYDDAVNVISELDSKIKNNMKTAKAGLIALALLCSGALSANAADAASALWSAANASYAAGDYAAALNSYKDIEAQDLVSADLYYNMGNACYKNSDIAHAILYYEKALKLDPSHKDASVNLELARQFTLDKIDVVPEFFLKTWTRNLKYMCSADAWAWITLALALVTVALLLGFSFLASEKGRRLSFISACVTFVLAVAALLFSLSEKADAKKSDKAVVMQPVTSVKSSPGDGGKSIFMLHEGTKVVLLDELGSWLNVEISDGRQGWVEASSIEKI